MNWNGRRKQQLEYTEAWGGVKKILLLSFCSLLAHRHHPWQHDQAIGEGKWRETGDFCFWLHPWQELQGQTFGVIGFGRIGQATARLAHAFGMRVLAYNHRPKDVPGDWFTWASMDQVLQESDIVSLHCPLTESTDLMVDTAFLAKMKNDAILVNASRGGLVNEPDLAWRWPMERSPRRCWTSCQRSRPPQATRC